MVAQKSCALVHEAFFYANFIVFSTQMQEAFDMLYTYVPISSNYIYIYIDHVPRKKLISNGKKIENIPLFLLFCIYIPM